MKKVGKAVKAALIGVLCFIILFLACMAYIWFGVLQKYYNVPEDKKAVTAYTQDMGLVDDDVYEFMQNSERAEKYELGVNKAGDVVFVKPRSAFNAAKKDLKTGWKYVDKELGEKHLSKTFYVRYIEIAENEIDSDKNASKEVKEQLKLLAKIFRIYQNSFPEKAYR